MVTMNDPKDAGSTTVTELHEMLEGRLDSLHCGVVAVRNRRGIQQESPCGWRVRSLLLVTCSQHGRARKPVCRFHLWMIKRRIVQVCCFECDQPAHWVQP
jgi:hypothetical protein